MVTYDQGRTTPPARAAARATTAWPANPSVPLGRCGAWNSSAPSGTQAIGARAIAASMPAGRSRSRRTSDVVIGRSVDQEAAVDVGDLAGDVPRVRRAQEGDQRGDLVGRPEPADRDPRHEVPRVRDHLGVD